MAIANCKMWRLAWAFGKCVTQRAKTTWIAKKTSTSIDEHPLIVLMLDQRDLVSGLLSPNLGEPITFTGDPDDDDSVIEEKVWVVRTTIQSMVNRALREREAIFW